MTKRDFLRLDSLSSTELGVLLERAAAMKADRGPMDVLAGRSIAVIFEKPSTRTRVSFEVGIAELGASPVVLTASDLQLGRGETIEDTARTLSRYVHAIVIRTFAQERLERLARAASVPVVNALSDYEHPCQVLADLLTIGEHRGSLAGQTLAYVGDGNNVAHSLMLGAALSGMHIRVGAPAGYEPLGLVVQRATEIAHTTGATVTVTNDAHAAVADAGIVYTDVWASMGQEREAEERRILFAPYQVSEALLGAAADDAIVMHCLPAHRGDEITDEVVDGPRSVVFDQAENRLHTQKALLAWLLG